MWGILKKTTLEKAVEKAQWVKCSLLKEDLSSDPQYEHSIRVWWDMSVTPVLQGELGGFLKLVVQPALTQGHCSGERHCLPQKGRGGNWERYPDVNLRPSEYFTNICHNFRDLPAIAIWWIKYHFKQMLRKTSIWKGDSFCWEIGKSKTIITLIGVFKGMKEQTKELWWVRYRTEWATNQVEQLWLQTKVHARAH